MFYFIFRDNLFNSLIPDVFNTPKTEVTSLVTLPRHRALSFIMDWRRCQNRKKCHNGAVCCLSQLETFQRRLPNGFIELQLLNRAKSKLLYTVGT